MKTRVIDRVSTQPMAGLSTAAFIGSVDTGSDCD